MIDEIKKSINERVSNHTSSMCASRDEVWICWLLAEVERLKAQIDICHLDTREATARRCAEIVENHPDIRMGFIIANEICKEFGIEGSEG